MSLPRDYIIPQRKVGLHAGSVIEDGENVAVVTGEVPPGQPITLGPLGAVEGCRVSEDDSCVHEASWLLTWAETHL